MKPYSEVAVVKDGNKRVGWLLKKGNAGDVVPAFEYVTDDQFIQMVAQGLVQFFTLENSQLKINYTDEELKYFKKYKIQNNYNNLTDFLSHDINLQYRYLNSAWSGGMPYVYVLHSQCAGGRFSGNVSVDLQAYIFYNNIDAVYSLLMSQLQNDSSLNSILKGLYSKTIQPKTNYMIVYLPMHYFENLGKTFKWNITCKGLKIANDILLNSNSKKSVYTYNHTAKGTTMGEIIKRVETV